MIRSALGKVTWMARATTTVVGLAIMLALVFGVATTALGANGQAWILGKANSATAITKLAGAAGVNGPMLQLLNNNPGANDTALDLRVQAGEAPMRVNSQTKVANLNADQVDGQGFACPGGTLFHEGVCIDVSKRPPAPQINAERDCLDEGKRLPTVAELQTFRNRGGHDFTGLFYDEWTSAQDYYYTTAGASVVLSDGNVGWSNISNPQNYRCVTPAS